MSRLLPCILLVLSIATAPIARAQDGPIAPVTSSPVAPQADGNELLWPPRAPPEALARPVLRRGHDMGLVSFGIAMLSVGMMVGIGIASADLAGRGNCHEFSAPFFTSTQVQCGTAPMALIPFAGSLIVGTVGLHGSTSVETILPGMFAVAPQILGLVFLLLGVHGFTEDLGSRDDDLSVRLEPILSGTQLGLNVRMSL